MTRSRFPPTPRRSLPKPKVAGSRPVVRKLAKVLEAGSSRLAERYDLINHPAVTAAIVGPRTMEQLESQLPSADIKLSDEVLDRIDQIVTPGININPADGGWVNPALEPAARRR